MRLRKRTKDEEYNHWVKAIRYCRSARRDMEKCWKRWYNIIDDNLFRGKMASGGEAIEVNELTAIVENIMPSIALKPGQVEIRSFAIEDMEEAAIDEAIARYLIRQYDLHRDFSLTIYDALVLGDGIMKLGYWLSPLVTEAQWRAGLGAEMSVSALSAFALNVPLFEIYPDYAADRWSRQRFIVHEIDKHIDELRDNPILEQSVVRKIKPNRTVEKLFNLGLERQDAKEAEYVTIQEIYDFPNGQLLIMAGEAGPKQFLYRGDAPFPFIPVERLEFFPRPLNVWGKSISQSVESHILSLSKLHNYMEMAVKKESLIKLLVNAALIPDKLQKKFETSKDEVIPVKGNPQGATFPVDYRTVSSNYSFERAMDRKMATLRELSGVTYTERGIHEPGVQTATESAMLKGASEVRNAWRSEMFSKFASRVLEKLLYIVTTTYEPARIAKMVGYPVEAIRPYIRPYDPSRFVLEYGQAAAASNIERIQKLQVLVNMIGPALNPAMVLKLLTDALGFEYSDALLIQGQLLQTGGASGAMSQSPAGTPGRRPAETGEAQMRRLTQ